MLARARLWQPSSGREARVAIGGCCCYTYAWLRVAKPTGKSKSSCAFPRSPRSSANSRRSGAGSHGRVLEQNTLYDTPQSDFRRTRPPSSPAHREHQRRARVLPTAPSAQSLTAKAPPGPEGAAWRSGPQKSRYKERLERELVGRRPARLAALPLILWASGPAFVYEKYRTTFDHPPRATVLDLDETPVGVFLELEGPPASIDRVARLLGFRSSRLFPRHVLGSLCEPIAASRGRRPEIWCSHVKIIVKTALFA